MPAGDRTGPRGMGPRTGRGFGYCSGYDVPGYAQPYPGRGMRMGRGGGFGQGNRWRNVYYATGLPYWARQGYAPAPGYSPAPGYAPPPAMSKEQEVGSLKEQAEWLRDQLETINRRITELDE